MEKVTCTLHWWRTTCLHTSIYIQTTLQTSVESGKLVMISVKGVKECKGIVTMKTVKGADDVIKHMNGSKIGDHVIQIEKRSRDPTKPKEPKANKEV